MRATKALLIVAASVALAVCGGTRGSPGGSGVAGLTPAEIAALNGVWEDVRFRNRDVKNGSEETYSWCKARHSDYDSVCIDLGATPPFIARAPLGIFIPTRVRKREGNVLEVETRDYWISDHPQNYTVRLTLYADSTLGADFFPDSGVSSEFQFYRSFAPGGS